MCAACYLRALMEPTRVSHFEIVRRIGRGGMGEVYEALDLKLRRRVALKFLSPELAMDADALTRFEREALSAAELNHPHIATVYAFEQEADRPFIAMELLTGSSLRDRIDHGALPVADALAIARDVAAALGYAHRRGTSHRDIKPENLMFDEHGTIKIMDFGLARATMASKLTVTGTSLGTPAYMAPEAIRGQSGPEGDVFALGLVLYEMLAGRRAYPGDNAMAVMFAIANEDPSPLSETRGDVPEAVETIVAALLAKDPAQRMDAATAARELSAMTGVAPPSASGMAFEPGVAGASVAATSAVRTAVIPAAGTSAMRTAAMPSATPTATAASRDSRSKRWLFFAGPAVAIGASMFVIFNGPAASKRRAETARKQTEAVAIQSQAVQRQEQGDLAAARALFQQALVLDPTQAGALTGLGRLYEADSLYPSAESLYRAVIRHNPKDPKLTASAYYNLASVQLSQRVYPAAVTSLRTSISLDSSQANVYNNLGVALIDNGQASEALQVLERGIRAFPGEAYLYKNAARAALKLGDPSRAITLVDRAIALDPDFFEARALRAQAMALPPTPGGGTP